MDSQQAWNSLEIAKFIASLATPIAVALVGFWINAKLKEHEDKLDTERRVEAQRRDDAQKAEDRRLNEAQRAEDRRFEESQRKLYREDQPRIELTLACKFHGIRGDTRLATFTVSAKNVGRVRHQIDLIKLRVRAINGEPFAYREETEEYLEDDRREPRVLFPQKVLETDLVPVEWNFIFIEPGVTQDLSFTKAISVDHSFLLAHVVFDYDEYEPHTTESIFAVPPARVPVG